MSLKIKIFLSLLFAVTLTQCNKDPGFEEVGFSPETPSTSAMIHNFEANSYRQKKLLWHLKSKTAYIYDIKKVMHFDGVDLVQYENKKKSYVTAGKGEFNEKNRIMTIQENVVLISHNGRRLYSEYLKWDENTGLITTNRPVKIIFPEGDVIRGRYGMIADQRLERIELLGAEGTHQPQEQ